MHFRPCIDLHKGLVKQIVGGTLCDDRTRQPETNYQTQKPASWFAELYRQDHLTGGHVIKLGPGNDDAAKEALRAWPGGMQIGGGITAANAKAWLDAGAAAVIVTSWVFHAGNIDDLRLKQLCQSIGKERLVLDLSCRKMGNHYLVVTDRWQKFTQQPISYPLLDHLSRYCCEYLIHAVDQEGRCQGIEEDLVSLLGNWSGVPITYAGGIHTLENINTIGTLGRGRVNFTVGSALDLFGGSQLSYRYLADHFGSDGNGVETK